MLNNSLRSLRGTLGISRGGATWAVATFWDARSNSRPSCPNGWRVSCFGVQTLPSVSRLWDEFPVIQSALYAKGGAVSMIKNRVAPCELMGDAVCFALECVNSALKQNRREREGVNGVLDCFCSKQLFLLMSKKSRIEQKQLEVSLQFRYT